MRKVLLKILSGLIAALLLSWAIAAWTNCPGISDLRDIWIETAMTTGEHQWLATAFFPRSLIDQIMKRQVNEIDGIAGLKTTPIQIDSDVVWESAEEDIGDVLGQDLLTVGGDDGHGGIILVNDIEQGIVISEIHRASYVAKLAQISDPGRVVLAQTDQKGTRGKLICDYLSDENAILGVNASGFLDYEGHGLGGQVIGRSLVENDFWGDYIPSQYTMGFTKNDRFIAGDISDWAAYDLRCAIQSKPVIIKDGKDLMDGSGGWGLQPRTIIAQRADGAVMFLVVDGRKPGYSLGATMGECAELLLEYGAETAAACDGGSSSVMAWDGEIINKPSTPMKTGRYLPNAFLVLRTD